MIPPEPALTCIHREALNRLGLCSSCKEEFETDPLAFIEYGSHPEGIRRWEALQAEMLEGRAADCCDDRGPPPGGYDGDCGDDWELPF